MDISSLERISDYAWRVPRTGRMRVPGVIYAADGRDFVWFEDDLRTIYAFDSNVHKWDFRAKIFQCDSRLGLTDELVEEAISWALS